MNQSDIYTFNLNHSAHYKLQFLENNFSSLAASNLEFFLLKVDIASDNNLQQFNSDQTIIGKGHLEFDKVFMSMDFYYKGKIEIYSYNTNEEPKQDLRKNKAQKINSR